MPLSFQSYGPYVILVMIAILSIGELVKYLRHRGTKHSS